MFHVTQGKIQLQLFKVQTYLAAAGSDARDRDWQGEWHGDGDRGWDGAGPGRGQGAAGTRLQFSHRANPYIKDGRGAAGRGWRPLRQLPAVGGRGRDWGGGAWGASFAPLRQEPVVGEEALLVLLVLVVAVFGLDGVRGQQHGRLRRAVHLVREDGIFHLQVKQLLRAAQTHRQTSVATLRQPGQTRSDRRPYRH